MQIRTRTLHMPDRYRLGYRSDVEGLRALAILLVVAAHARLKWLTGGFIGVDIFYVLSGYLITGLLVQEIQGTGSLGLVDFYARRLRRLMPALLLMIAIACLGARLLLPAGEQPEQASAAASAILWLSNFHFTFSRMDYFAPGSETNLFLHTWSLGVEEQFYLVWPLLLILAMRAWEGAKSRPGPRQLEWIMLGTFGLSFALSLYWTYTAPQLGFYMMPSRAWQFALGALVFLKFGSPACRSGALPMSGEWVLRACGWTGLGLILCAALLINASFPYPGVWALLPSFGTALLLAAGGQEQRQGVGALLSWGPMQAIGRVSYAWYLWHWPVLLLGATLLDFSNSWIRAALAALSLGIAALSYHFFETPIRRNRKLLVKPYWAVFVALALMVLASSFALRWYKSALTRMGSPEQLRYEMARADAPTIYGMGCDEWYHSARVRVCAFGQRTAKHVAVTLGDSVALQWFPAYAQIFEKPDWRLLVITKSSCPMVDAPIFYTRIGREYTECAQWRHDALKLIADIRPDVIVLGSTYTYDFTARQWVEGTRSVLQALAGSTRQIFIMRSTPTLPFDGPECLEPRSWLYKKLSIRAECTGPAHNTRGDNVVRWLRAAAAPFSNVRIIDMTSSICPGGLCRAELGHEIVFRDSQHLSASFARSLGPALANAFGMQPAAVPTGTNKSPASNQQGAVQ